MIKQTFNSIQVFLKEGVYDGRGVHLRRKIIQYYNADPGIIKSGKLYIVDYPLAQGQLEVFASEALGDKVINEIRINAELTLEGFASVLVIAKLPGVTDDEGMSAQKALFDIFDTERARGAQHIFSQDVYFIQNNIPPEVLRKSAGDFLCNKLINHIETGNLENPVRMYVPEVQLNIDNTVEIIDIDLPAAELQKLSDSRLLSLNIAEMNAVKDYFRSEFVKAPRRDNGMPLMPTDCELEIIAQTWSEHCKHKEFNALITYTDQDTGESFEVDSLFKTYIKGATESVKENLERQGKDWLVKVFSDNAGVVKINENELFVWKVETHNSPSAIDPYGGAITGILGNNRDPLGTGIGGAKLLFNTNVLCFGPPSYSKPLLTGQLHPKRIFEGVRKGIEDGGNKSGIPTINGSVIFDERYSGKPLVYCGTGGVMPADYNGRPSWEKIIDPGDFIVSVGGRVGKDGIHGATFSSREIDEHSPQSAVQIGSPIVQKLASDFLEIACRQGLVKTSTDCGAGGLSSAVGELASISGGAVVMLEKVLLKYSGLKPWEIFLSESQERMILVIEPACLDAVLELAERMEVEASVIGKFTDDGILRVDYEKQRIAMLHLDFLHDGVPRKLLEAEWSKPQLVLADLPVETDLTKALLAIMGSDAVSSREYIIRQYDHEVKGKTIIKPLMGERGSAPQDAAVIRVNLDSFEAIAVSNGIMPKYVDADPYNSAAGAFDEAIRQIIAVGGRLPECGDEQIFWSVNDNFCVPDSVYHPENNPDGRRKLAQLVQMCRALYDLSTFYSIPMTSGKDSMKNDFKADGIKISVPPTILFSAASKINDARKTITSDFKAAGSLIYIVGSTYNEPGESEFLKYLKLSDTRVPIVRKEEAKSVYEKMIAANDMRLLLSAHDISDGGLAAAAAECCFGSMFGAHIAIPADIGMSSAEYLFSESHSRFIISVDPAKRPQVEECFAESARFLGVVSADGRFIVSSGGRCVIECLTSELFSEWSNGLTRQVI